MPMTLACSCGVSGTMAAHRRARRRALWLRIFSGFALRHAANLACAFSGFAFAHAAARMRVFSLFAFTHAAEYAHILSGLAFCHALTCSCLLFRCAGVIFSH